MKILKKILFLSIIILVSCEKNEDSIDTSKLLYYNFLFTSHSITTDMDNEIIENKYDTTVYSFFENDTVIAFKKVFKSVENEVKYDTICATYAINNSSINFSRFDNTHDYLLAYHWDIISLSEEYLKIKLIGPYGYSGEQQLICINK
ncbi:MAG: hypothetical protein R6V16_04320 [Bacteroidales bacterium]